jgi:hypothetical protein
MPDTSDFDHPWKDLIQRFFPDFMAFFFPEVASRIDWQREFAFLEQELRQVVRDAETGPKRVDKLARVWLFDGEEQHILIHIEVQSQSDSEFGERLFVYHYRLHDAFGRRVLTVAVLADDEAQWRPDGFDYELLGCSVRFRFPHVKLLDFEARADWLEAHNNPFAVATLAHLRTLGTRRDDGSRHAWKLRLVKSLYERQYSRAEILELFRFIDWLMVLPLELKRSFAEQIELFEQERQMPYVTSIERDAIERGMQQGMLEGMQQGMQQGRQAGTLELLLRQLTRRCGPLDSRALERIRQLGIEQQEELGEALLDFASIADLERWLHDSAN